MFAYREEEDSAIFRDMLGGTCDGSKGEPIRVKGNERKIAYRIEGLIQNHPQCDDLRLATSSELAYGRHSYPFMGSEGGR